MTLTNSLRLQPHPVYGSVEGNFSNGLNEGLAEALPLVDLSPGNNQDWTYSATAESLGGEVAGSQGYDVDEEPGLIYAGAAGGAVTVEVADLDLAPGWEGAVAEATDTWNVVIFRNNEMVGGSDEGATGEFDSETVEFNCESYVGNLQTGDVLRVCLVATEGNEDDVAVKVTSGCSLMLG